MVDTHVMKRIGIHPANESEDWFCSICGRRFILESYNPFVRTVLDEGDLDVRHVGGTGLTILGIEMTQPDDIKLPKPIQDFLYNLEF